MGSLTFQVGLGHMTDNSMVIGQAVVSSLKQLTPRTPLKGYIVIYIYIVALRVSREIKYFSLHVHLHCNVDWDIFAGKIFHQ